MPKIINAYSPDDSIGSALRAFGESFFANTPQTELARQKAKGLIRENENLPLLADALVAGDVNAAARAGILSGLDPKNVGGYGQYLTVNRYGPASREATTATMAVPGANYGNTVAGTRESEANRIKIEGMRTQRLFDAERYKTDNTPQTYLDENNQPVIGRLSETFGRRPILTQNQAQGVILQQDMGGYTSEQRARAAGVAPKAPSSLYTYRTPTGGEGTTIDGVTDAHTGQPLPQGTKAIKLEGPSPEGLTGNNEIDKRLLESRTATEQTKALITQLRQSLATPNAAQAIGLIGTGVSMFNNMRAQIEAGVSLVGGSSAAQELSAPGVQQAITQATNSIFGNAAWNQRAQQLGIDHAKLQSQIQDLAYAMAKSQDPSGRISVDDIRRAAETIGATLMDPRAADAVLADVGDRIERNQQIRERVTRQMFPKVGAAPSAPAPQAPGTAPQAPIRWERGANGRPVRVQ